MTLKNDKKTNTEFSSPIAGKLLRASAILFMLTFLRNSDSYYSPYLVSGIAGLLCIFTEDGGKRMTPCAGRDGDAAESPSACPAGSGAGSSGIRSAGDGTGSSGVCPAGDGTGSSGVCSAGDDTGSSGIHSAGSGTATDGEITYSGLPGKGVRVFAVVLACIFSLSTIAANYSLFTKPDVSYFAGRFSKIAVSAISAALCFAGGFFSSHALLMFLAGKGGDKISNFIFCTGSIVYKKQNRRVRGNIRPDAAAVRRSGGCRKTFILSALCIAVVDCAVLFLADYPGILTEDSISQIEQLLSGVYSNHHPYYHTQLIRLCISAGLRLFGTMNAAVAVYSVF